MGFTLQLTLKVIPHGRSILASALTVAKGKAADVEPSSSAEDCLIETE
jgi:hypothetical protein